MSDLLPCPFCGGEAKVFHYSSAIRDEVWRAVCDKPFCAQGPDGYTEAEAIAAWNTRAERTCHADEVTHRNCKYSINRGWRELTCHIVERQEEPQCGVLVRDYTFSCGHCICWAHTYEPRYCPNCGAKVVGE